MIAFSLHAQQVSPPPVSRHQISWELTPTSAAAIRIVTHVSPLITHCVRDGLHVRPYQPHAVLTSTHETTTAFNSTSLQHSPSASTHMAVATLELEFSVTASGPSCRQGGVVLLLGQYLVDVSGHASGRQLQRYTAVILQERVCGASTVSSHHMATSGLE
jgi:hypothetical protein